MKKVCKYFIVVVAFLICTQAVAPKGWRVGVSINPGISTTESYGFVLGSDVRLQTGIGNKVSFILTSGLTHFFETVKSNAYTVVPIKGGFKSFLGDNLYAAIEAGVGVGLSKGTEASFVWSPSFGLAFKQIDVSLKYEDFTKYQSTKQVALRFAYGFKVN